MEGTVFTNMHILMAAERSHRDPKWEHQADTGSVLLFLSFLYRESARGVCIISAALRRGQECVDSFGFLLLVDLCNGEFEGGSGLQFVNVGGQNGKSEF